MIVSDDGELSNFLSPNLNAIAAPRMLSIRSIELDTSESSIFGSTGSWERMSCIGKCGSMIKVT